MDLAPTSPRAHPQSQQLDKRIHYRRQGNGDPVILLHGVAASLHDWNRLMPELVGHGYLVLAPDLPGHGESFKPADPGFYQVDCLYEQVAAWIDGLALNHVPVLIGHSMGGYLCLLYALRNAANVRGLVLINPLYSPEQLSPLMHMVRRRPIVGEKALRLTPEWLMNLLLGWDPTKPADFPAEARRRIANDYKRASPYIVNLTRSFPDLTPLLPQLTLPTLILWGSKDLTLEPASFPRLAQSMPNAVSLEIPGCGHLPHIGKPAVVNRAILDFITHLPCPAPVGEPDAAPAVHP